MEEQRKSAQKKKEQAAQGQTPRVMKVGDMLRTAREGRGKSVEDISASINIRSVQIRAIESGNIDALPGMTYAVGFVRSYANHLGLDSDELVRQFKKEHSEVPEKPDLHFPSPVSESHLPSPMVLAGAGGAAVLLLIVWAFFSSSGGDEENAAVTDIPAIEKPVETAAVVEAPAVAPETPLVPDTTAEVPVVSPVTVPPAAPVVAATTSAEQTTVSVTPDVAVAMEQDTPPVEIDPSRIVQKPKNLLETAGDFGAVKSGSRVTIEALKPSWIQVTTVRDAVVFKKVLQPGEKYNVPAQEELFLITSNAGGLAVYVDGKKVQDIGDEGEIVRGVSLNPKDLSLQRIRMNRR